MFFNALGLIFGLALKLNSPFLLNKVASGILLYKSIPNTSLKKLIFRAPLGTVLDNDVTQTTRTSIHPQISTIPPVQSFILS